MRTYIALGSCFGLGLLAAHGCRYSEVDPLHCGNNEGDAYCAEQFSDGSRPYCELGAGSCISSNAQLGCVAERPADECYSPCGGRSAIDENGACVMVEDSSSGTSSGGTETEESSGSSESSSTTGPMPCETNDDCADGGAPFCEPASGECVTCDQTEDGDAACAELDPAAPVCLGDACVQCTAAAPEACTNPTPVCDDATNTCVPCTAHDQCGEAACNLYTGACLPGDAVVHVGGATPDFATLELAVASFVGDGAEGTVIVHAGPSYDESVTVDANRVLAFLAADGDVPQWIESAVGDLPQLAVTEGSTVLMDGMQLSSNSSSMTPALRVTGGRAWLDRSRIVQNTGGGILAETGAELTLRNCFVGDGTNGANGLTVDGAAADVVYSSLGAGVDNFEDVFPVFCNGAVDVSIRNSLLVSFDNPVELSCGTAMVTNTASESLIPGTGNVALGDVGATWFVDIDTGNFHLDTPPAILASTAQWNTGDPPTDIDGDLRPTDDGSPDYAGADVP
jgi:hypothetical protein